MMNKQFCACFGDRLTDRQTETENTRTKIIRRFNDDLIIIIYSDSYKKGRFYVPQNWQLNCVYSVSNNSINNALGAVLNQKKTKLKLMINIWHLDKTRQLFILPPLGINALCIYQLINCFRSKLS